MRPAFFVQKGKSRERRSTGRVIDGIFLLLTLRRFTEEVRKATSILARE